MPTLRSAIETLYQTFSQYTTLGIHHCDCGCIDEDDVKKLYSKTLSALEADDLASYHGSAMYTWGGVEHYKHYLPRICELNSLQRESCLADVGEIYAKLKHANWWEWGSAEVAAIKEYVWQDWLALINGSKTSIGEIELGDYGNFFTMTKLIGAWNFEESSQGLINLVDFFYFNGNQLLNGGLKINNKKYENELIPFFCNQKVVQELEKEFFAHEAGKTEYADRVSIVLQMIEQEIKNGRK